MCNLPVQKRQLALGGCLHVESKINSYGEVIDRFGLCLAVEPLYLLTSQLDTLSIRLWNSDLDLGLVWCTGQAWICMLDPRERSAEAHRGFGGLASSTLHGAGTH